jgi:hypothetical protein
VDTITASRIANMKELRPPSAGRSEIRILLVFDPWRSVVLLGQSRADQRHHLALAVGELFQLPGRRRCLGPAGELGDEPPTETGRTTIWTPIVSPTRHGGWGPRPRT